MLQLVEAEASKKNSLVLLLIFTWLLSGCGGPRPHEVEAYHIAFLPGVVIQMWLLMHLVLHLRKVDDPHARRVVRFELAALFLLSIVLAGLVQPIFGIWVFSYDSEGLPDLLYTECYSLLAAPYLLFFFYLGLRLLSASQLVWLPLGLFILYVFLSTLESLGATELFSFVLAPAFPGCIIYLALLLLALVWRGIEALRRESSLTLRRKVDEG